jgi:hypothetical protein
MRCLRGGLRRHRAALPASITDFFNVDGVVL